MSAATTSPTPQTSATRGSSVAVPAQWFDGQSARRANVQLLLSGRTLRVVREDGTVIAHVPRDLITVSERIANTPYRLSFPDGALAVVKAHKVIEAYFRLNYRSRLLTWMERAAPLVAIALFGLVVGIYFTYTRLIPIAADAVAMRIPFEAERRLGDISMQGLDRFWFRESRLSGEQKADVQRIFDQLAEVAGAKERVRLEHRWLIPNALAIPGGTIVVSDGLYVLFKGDERLLAAVIAHEIGHIEHRHSLRQLLAGSASAVLVGVLTGDISGVSALTTAAPLALSNMHYGREAERDADQYAFDLLKKAGRSPQDFADSMRRFDQMERCYALRAQDWQDRLEQARASGKRFPSEDNDLDDDEDYPSASNTGRTIFSNRCINEPEVVLQGRELDLARLKQNEGDEESESSGYFSTHPGSQDRIRAAEAAAR